MAAATAKDTPPRTQWLLLGEYFVQKLAEVRSPKLAERLVRKELHEKQRPYCYLDCDGKPYQDDLPDDFWLQASLDLATSSATRPARTVPLSADPLARVLATIPRREVQFRPTRQHGDLSHLMGPPRPRERLIPCLEIFRIEVLVRRPDAAPPVTERLGLSHDVDQAKFRKSGAKPKFDWDAIQAECGQRIFGDGPPDNVSALSRQLIEWSQKQFGADKMPDERTMRRYVTKWIAAWERSLPPQK